MGLLSTEPLPMETALAEITEGRKHLIVALDIIEKRRDCYGDAKYLRAMVGDLAAMISRWERERARWVVDFGTADRSISS